MSRPIKWILGLAIAAGLAALMIWAFTEGRREMARERERELPIKVPSRVARNEAGETVITLDPDSQQRIGLETMALTPVNHATEYVATGHVADQTALIALDAEFTASNAALSASRSEWERQRAMSQSGSTTIKSLETAEAQFRADEARARTARQQLALAWCEQVVDMDESERRALIARVVVVDLPAGETLTTPRAGGKVIVFGHEDHPLPATILCPEQQTETATQGQGYWLRVDESPFALSANAAVTAYLSTGTSSRSGVVVPRSAVVRVAGQAWVYVQTDAQAFARREIALDQATENGWFVVSGATAGDRVVITGAQMLLSEEMKSQIQVGEEGERR